MIDASASLPIRRAGASQVALTGLLLVTAGAALSGWAWAAGTPVERGVQGAMAAVAVGALVAAPGVLALMALSGRPALLIAAALALVPVSSLSLATVPLLLAAVVLGVAAVQRLPHLDERPVHSVVVPGVLLVLLNAGFVTFLTQTEMRSYTGGTGGGTSEVVTLMGSCTSLGLIAAALVVGWLTTAPQPR